MIEINRFGQPIGDPLSDWRPPPVPPREAMHGLHCRLEPLDPALHADGLWSAFDEAPDGRDWTYLARERPARPDALRAWLDEIAPLADPLFYAIVRDDGRAVGMAAHLRIDPANGVVEIGHIAYARSLQCTAAGTEAVHLLAERVFALGYRRLEWKCDDRNAPSRRAALRYGFAFEGVFRQAVVTKGRNRDTAWYAMTDADWPARRDALRAWLAPENFDAGGRQRRSLEQVRAGKGGRHDRPPPPG